MGVQQHQAGHRESHLNTNTSSHIPGRKIKIDLHLKLVQPSNGCGGGQRSKGGEDSDKLSKLPCKIFDIRFLTSIS